MIWLIVLENDGVNHKMKKVLMLILTCYILLEISGCGNKNNATQNTNFFL